MIPVFGLSLILSLLLCVHVVRSKREIFWIFIILLFQPLGGLVYLFAIVLPEFLGGRTARRFGAVARETLDPGRDYREAKAAHDDSPTVANAMRLARAAVALGRHEEAERLYAEAAVSIHADDPTLLLGRANALVELGRFADALRVLEQLSAGGEAAATPQATLTLARVYEGLGRTDEAGKAYESAAARLPGLEGMARYAAFLAHTGRRDEAEPMLKELDRRAGRADAAFRKEARAWRDFAYKAVQDV